MNRAVARPAAGQAPRPLSGLAAGTGQLAIGAVLILSLSVAAAPGFEVSTWQFRRAISLLAKPAAYAQIVLDGEVYAASQEMLGDLRVVTANGTEVQYLLQHWPGERVEEPVASEVVRRATTAGESTYFELRVFRSGTRHNQVRLAIEGTNFTRQVVVEDSDDRRSWQLLAADTVYRFAEGAAGELTTIAYPPSSARYVRITIHNEGKPALKIEGATVVHERSTPPREHRWFAGAAQVISDAETRTSSMIIDSGFARVPVSRIAMEIAAPLLFARDAEVAVSADAQQWSDVARWLIVRGPGAPREALLQRVFPEARARYVRVRIHNGDNPPLSVTRAALYGIRRTMLFPVSGGSTHYLYLGNGSVASPDYDLPRVLDVAAATGSTIAAVLGPVEANPAFTPPVVRRPWTEEHPYLLWGALGASILVILVLIVRTARGVGPST